MAEEQEDEELLRDEEGGAEAAGHRLQVQWSLDPRTDSARLPPLLLQPLLENAVHHGVEPSASGAQIREKPRQWHNLHYLSTSGLSIQILYKISGIRRGQIPRQNHCNLRHRPGNDRALRRKSAREIIANARGKMCPIDPVLRRKFGENARRPIAPCRVEIKQRPVLVEQDPCDLRHLLVPHAHVQCRMSPPPRTARAATTCSGVAEAPSTALRPSCASCKS